MLATRTEALLLELEAARGDVLSLADLNRTLRVLLRNQVAILRGLAERKPALAAPLHAAPLHAAPLHTAPLHTAPTNGVAGPGLELPAREPQVFVLDADDSGEQVPVAGAETAGAETEPGPTEAGSTEAGSTEAAETGSTEEAGPGGEGATASRAEALLGVTIKVEGRLAREMIAAFDHRDHDYEKGLQKLTLWTEGSGGTPFQLRGERAYLNVGGSSREGVQNYEQNLMKRMGFVRRLGRLVIPGLAAEVVVYERP